MRRRDLLRTLAGTAVVASAGCSGSPTGSTQAGDGQDPITVDLLDAPGSDGGTATVPAESQVSFVEFFATTCSVCEGQMDTLAEAHETVGSEVQFLSVTSQPVGYTVSRSEVASWWDDHGGSWPIGVDDGTALAQRYDATSVPTALLIRPDGSVAWSHTGEINTDRIVEAVRETTGEQA